MLSRVFNSFILVVFLSHVGCIKSKINGTQPNIFPVVDQNNNRVLIFGQPITSGVANAGIVLGQPDMASNAVNNGGTVSAQTINDPEDVLVTSNLKLCVTDRSNSRLLIWNSFPTQNFQPPHMVWGQTSFNGGTANAGLGAPTSQTLAYPDNLFSDGVRLFVSDGANYRVLIWNSFPLSSAQPADVELGQPDMNSGVINNGGVSAQSLNDPRGLLVVGTRLFVADLGNSRVLIWNTIPTVNHQPADLVLGQPDMVSNVANNGGISKSTLNYPIKLASDGTHLFVSDHFNNRVLIWNSLPTVNQQPADIVLGQPDMVSNVANNSGLSAQSFSHPHSIQLLQGKLYIVDNLNNRILAWNSTPTVNQQPADLVFAQPNFNSGSPSLTSATFNGPTGMFSDINLNGVSRFGGY